MAKKNPDELEVSSGGTGGEPTKEARGRGPLVRGLGQSPRMEDCTFPVSLSRHPLQHYGNGNGKSTRWCLAPSIFLTAPPSSYVTVLSVGNDNTAR